MQLFYQPGLSNGVHHLSEEESRHAVKVLRLKQGALIDITDGQGSFYKAIITEPHQKRCAFEVNSTEKQAPHPRDRHMAIAPTKNIDRLEWFVEKAVEFGVDRITPIVCHHSERRVAKKDRLMRKAVSAMKQSLKAWCPQIDDALPFNEFVSGVNAEHKFIAYVDETNTRFLRDQTSERGTHLVMIGPEGDFSPQEVEKAIAAGFERVSLGPSRLRTETAGIAAIHLLNL